jgi:hypothetical protein
VERKTSSDFWTSLPILSQFILHHFGPNSVNRDLFDGTLEKSEIENATILLIHTMGKDEKDLRGFEWEENSWLPVKGEKNEIKLARYEDIINLLLLSRGKVRVETAKDNGGDEELTAQRNADYFPFCIDYCQKCDHIIFVDDVRNRERGFSLPLVRHDLDKYEQINPDYDKKGWITFCRNWESWESWES